MCKVVECTYVERNSMCRYIHIAWTSITHHTFRVLTNPQFFSSVSWSVHYSGSTNWVQDWSNFLIWLQFKGRSWYKNQQFIYQDSKLLLSYSFLAGLRHTVAVWTQKPFTPLLMSPQGSQGCQKMCQHPLKSKLKVWWPKIEPKLSSFHKTVKI